MNIMNCLKHFRALKKMKKSVGEYKKPVNIWNTFVFIDDWQGLKTLDFCSTIVHLSTSDDLGFVDNYVTWTLCWFIAALVIVNLHE